MDRVRGLEEQLVKCGIEPTKIEETDCEEIEIPVPVM